MSDGSQIITPESFIRLYVPRGRHKPTLAREQLAERHEFCEDLAQMLTESAQDKLWELGITESDVLQRMHQGLAAQGLGLTAGESWWVLQRLAELLGWPAPDIPAPEPG